MSDDDYESPITKAWAGKYLEQDKEITIQQAIERLVRAWREHPDYRQGWQDNIAMAFADEYALAAEIGHIVLWQVCNNAADRVLKGLEMIGKPDSEI